MFLGISFSQKSNTKAQNYQFVEMKVNMHCNACKETIEKNIAFEKGVKDLVVDLESKTVKIKYDTRKTDPSKLKKAIEDLNYTCEILKIYSSLKTDENAPCCAKASTPNCCNTSTTKTNEKSCCSKKQSKKCCSKSSE